MAGLPDDVDAYAVVLSLEEGRWQAGLLPEVLVDDLAGLLTAVQQLPDATAAVVLVDVAHEFFVAVRSDPSGQPRMLLSDVTAAVAWDLAAQVLDRLGIDPPDDDELDEVVPAGDLSIFSDLGMDEMELGAVLADLDAYADEMLASIARRIGCADAYEHAVDVLVD